MMITFDSGTSRRITRVTSAPSMRGIDRSISTTSGRKCRVISIASSPSTASPQTDQSARDEGRERTGILPDSAISRQLRTLKPFAEQN